MQNEKKIEQILHLIGQKGILRPRELGEYNIPRIYLKRLYDRGLLNRSGRGLYALADSEVTEHHTLAQVSKRIPHGVVCLISALQFHNLTTQMPFEVWIATEKHTRKNRISYPTIRFAYFSQDAFSSGIEEHTIEGVPVKIYSPPKTIADCFKYRNKIGLDVALEALRIYRKRSDFSYDRLWGYARICRIDKIMKPYLEALA